MILRIAPSVVSEVSPFRFTSYVLIGEPARICIHAPARYLSQIG
jgi:hypothetical protein